VSVFVLDQNGKPLDPCSEKRARKLLARGRARVCRLYPFAIRVVDRKLADSGTQPLRLAIDPGSKATGLAIERVGAPTPEGPVMHVVFLMELVHRGAQIRDLLARRAMLRRGRRSRNLRHRAPRFDNRKREEGWLAPSLAHRVETTAAWVERLRRLAPISELAQELVRFDTQKLQNPEIEGVEHQRGTLFGFEAGEYLLAKWGRHCAYCDRGGAPLEKDHIVARSKGGSDRISNLALACRPCNQRKGARDIREFLKDDPARLKRILAQAKAPLRDAAAVNSTRQALLKSLKQTALPVEAGSGGRTKHNRVRLGVPKTHALDAACVGRVGGVENIGIPTFRAKCQGRGSRSRTRLDAFGFPRGYLTREKAVHGFRTGDMVKAVVPTGKKAGAHVGRVAIRARGSFNVQTSAGVVQGVSWRHCVVLARGDGYAYSWAEQDKGGAKSPASINLNQGGAASSPA
jgi:5-methylcytosine-specific restriction endonuclease McrA